MEAELFRQFAGLFTVALLPVALVARFAVASGATRKMTGVLSLVAFLVVVFPVSPLSLAELLRGYTGDLSMTTLLLLLLGITCRTTGKSWFHMDQVINLNITVVVAGLVLYPTSLGLFMTDTYAAGYENTFAWVAWLMVPVAMAGRQLLVSLALLLALVAHSPGVLESDNLWDYLVDPFVFIWSLGSVVRVYAAGLFSGRTDATA